MAQHERQSNGQSINEILSQIGPRVWVAQMSSLELGLQSMLLSHEKTSLTPVEAWKQMALAYWTNNGLPLTDEDRKFLKPRD